MASHLVGQRPVSTFVTPVAGASPIDANVVRSQDNTNGSTYTGHDADATIHVQDSILGSRSAAATAGRKWLTTDAGAFYLFYDDGAAWNEISYLRSSGGALSGALAITSASANALAVGLNGATNPAFNVDSSTALQVAGLNVIGAVTGGTVAVAVTDSGLNASLTINAKGTGTIGIGSVSTGRVTITPVCTITGALTLSAALTYGGVTLSNAVTGTGNMVLSAGPTFTGTAAFATVTTSSTINGQTISSAASFTGTVAVATSITVTTAGITVANDAGVTFGARGSLKQDGSFNYVFATNSVANAFQINVGGGATSAGLFTVSSGGLTVSAGTTAVQALTATTLTVSGGAGASITRGSATTLVVDRTGSAGTILSLTYGTEKASIDTTGALVLAAGISATTGTLTAAAPTVAAAQVGYGSTTQTTIGANGAASALTANPVGYLIINVAGNNRIVPYYNP